MTREEAVGWLKVINKREFAWDEYAMQESQREIRERCEQGVREAIDMAIEALSNKPTDEWCSDCKEYDHEKHCCPRFNRVIRTTLNEAVANLKEEFESADVVQGWNNHEVACMLAELFGDACACNYNGIDEWLPFVCDLKDSCPNTVGVACWEQFLKHYKERREP